MGSCDAELDAQSSIISTASSAENLDGSSTRKRRNRAFKRQNRIQEDEGLHKKMHSPSDRENSPEIMSCDVPAPAVSETLGMQLNHRALKENSLQHPQAEFLLSSLEKERTAEAYSPLTQDASTSTLDRVPQSERRNFGKPRKKFSDDDRKREARDRKRRVSHYDEESNEESNYERSSRKKRKTPTKKVMKLHSLTADLLLQVLKLNMIFYNISF